MGFTGWPPISVLWVSGPRRALPMDPVSEPIPGIPGPAAPSRGLRGDGMDWWDLRASRDWPGSL